MLALHVFTPHVRDCGSTQIHGTQSDHRRVGIGVRDMIRVRVDVRISKLLGSD